MNAELARKRIASYMRGNITKEELDAFLDGFGDELTEEAYTEFLREEFEKFVATENNDESHPEKKDAVETRLQPEPKRGKSTPSGKVSYRKGFSFCVWAAALCSFQYKYLKYFFSVSENLLTLKH